MIREKVVPVLWLLLAAVIIGACIGVQARAEPECWPPVAEVPAGEKTSCVMIVPGCWICPQPYRGNSIDQPALNGTP